MRDSPALCRDVIEHSPFPIVAVGRSEHIVLYANTAFRQFVDSGGDSLEGRPVAECIPQCVECIALLASVRESGIAKQLVEPAFQKSWMYSAWTLASDVESPRIVMLQVTETSEFHHRISALNESLLLSAVAQHESAEIADANAVSMSTALASSGVELDRTKEELRLLALELLKAQDDERRRIARELHDNISQQLAFLGMQLFHLSADVLTTPGQVALASIVAQMNTVSSEVRGLSHRLHSSALEDLGLEAALGGLLEEFESAHGIPICLKVTDLPPVALPVATTVFRIVQESLHNVVKHAGKDVQVTVQLSCQLRSLVLQVQDSGVGFDAMAARGQGRLGLISMQERALLVGGSLRAISEPGKGTAVLLVIPLM